MRKFFMSALAVVALAITATVQTVAQESFAYQAVIRDSEGILITEKEVGLQFSLMQGGQTYYVETWKTKTNQYGNITVEIGKGEKKLGSFADVPWHTLDITLKVEVDPAGGNKYITLGETKISPAPYAMYASKSGGVAKPNAAAKGSETLFEVNDRNGNPVFAVTNDGIVVYVDDTDAGKIRRSGFLITGRDATKDGAAQEYFSVTTDGTTIYVNGVDNNEKIRRSGFLITGRDATKDINNRYMAVDENGTHIYVDASDNDKIRRSGFLITGRDATKDNYSDVLKIDGNQTTVYVDGQDNSKVRRSGFLIVGRDATKADQNTYLTVTTDSTRLSTKSLTIASPGDSTFTLQKQDDRLWFRGDIALDGELRQKRPFNEKDWFKVYISDTARRDNEMYDEEEFKSSELWSTIQNNYHGNYLQGYYEFSSDLSYTDENDVEHYHDYGYMILASVDEKGMVLPCRSNGKILFDTDGQETTILENAVVMVSSYYSSSNGTQLVVHPLAKLSDYIFDVALLNPYNNEPMYERYTVNLNSSKPFAGCQVTMMINDDADYSFWGRVTTSEGSNEQELVGNGYWLETSMVKNAVYGSTATLEALTVPEGMVFKCWLKKENSYSSYGYAYFSNPLQVVVDDDRCYYEAVFEPIPPIMVNGTNGNDEIGNGNTIPYKTLGRALQHIADEGNSAGTHTIKLSSWLGDIAVGSDMNGKSAGITIDLEYCNSIDGTSDAEHPIDINTTVPITITNMSHFARLSTDRIVNVAKNASLTLDNCLVCGREYDDGSITDNASVGAAYVAGKLSLNNSQIRYFSAENGGGVYIANGGSLTLSSSTIEYCSADNGGGVYVATGGNIEIDNYSSISNNSANDNGGGVYFATVDGNNRITISGITENSANYGGGVYVAGGTLTISNDVYIYNNSATYGGGVYVKAGTFKLENGSIRGNNSNYDETTNGGGVYVNTNATFEMSGGSIFYNKATNGGGVYLKAKSGSAVSTFTMNGGYIYNNNNPSVDNAKGNGVYMGSGSVFNISGNAQLYWYGSYNNVYLASGTTINVSGDLSNSNVAMIVPQTYQANTPVVTSGNIAHFSRFTVEKQIVTNTFGVEMPIEWTIDNNGQLQKAATGDNSTVDGALQGLFSVSDNKTVRFSKGNLQYLASEDEWSFADSQTDKGDYNGNINISADNTGWINRFGYGTSGWNSGAKQYQPYSSDNTQTDYLQTSMTGSNANADWGVYNAISNGGNTHGMWRTLTADEWSYLFNGRGTTSDSQKKFGKARINFSGNSHVLGVIIFPDNWTMTQQDFTAAGISFTPGASPTNNGKVGYETNTLTEEQWQLLEANGAVFLPALGYRYVEVMTDNVSGEQTKTIKIEHGSYNADGTYATGMEPPYGFYWTASGSNVQFTTSELTTNANYRHDYGMCVRLVADVSDNGSADTHAKIDLGLPSGKKWAAVNLGSSIKPETEAVYTQYGSSYLGKYGNKVKWGATDLNSTANPSLSKTYDAGDVLELEDDPAYANWGGYWRVPTDEDWKELWENCFWKCDGTNQTWKVYRTSDEYKKGVHRKTGDYSQTGDPSGSGNLAIPYSSSIYYWTSVAANGSYAKRVLFEKNNDYSFSTYSRISEYYIRPVWVPITTTVFYVSPDGNDDSNDGTRANPFATIQQAASKMIDKYTSYTIFVDGELGGEQTLSGTIKARQITLRSGHRTDNISGSIAISTSTPVVVENLAISTLTVGEDATVTLAGGAVVGNASVSGAFTLKNNASANVVLGSGKTITLDGSFNGTGVAVKPADYTEGTPLITKPNGYLITAEMFTVTPGNDGSQWKIDEDGLLQKDE